MTSVLSLAALVALASHAPETPVAPVTPGERVLDAGFHHLGNDPTPLWTEASLEPEGAELEVRFTSAANEGEWLLFLRQRDVDDPWRLELNGRAIGTLRRGKEPVVRWYVVPPGAVREGENVLSVSSEKGTDDMTIGDLRLVEASRRERFELVPVRVRVSERGTERPLPARLTIVDVAGGAPDVFYGEGRTAAVRPGIVYTSNGEASFELPAGRYEVHALRGTEWSHATATLLLAPGGKGELALELAREVDTTGFVAADTHIHTYTFSGHGDSTVDERMVTLAAEGVELAVATDHNHQLDYRPYQEELGLTEHFTPVVGNEVTTENGHFNAFPLPPGTDVPAYDVKDWVKLVEGIRARGARVVILNHPRWPSLRDGPFGRFHYDRLTGERHLDHDGTPGGPGFTFDAMELVNSTAMLDDAHFLLRDWFGLLNRGERITAVGTSDSHTVGDPVGQGRTYVRSSTDDPAKIDVDEACDAFLRGDTTISLGMFAEVVVGEGRVPGELVPTGGAALPVRLRVAAPSWVRPYRVELYRNGEVVLQRDIEAPIGVPFDETFALELPPDAQDGWMVCFVRGGAVEDPCWRTQKPYTLAATNPVWLDADSDGAWRGPRDEARALVEELAGDPFALRQAMLRFDVATRLQVLSLVRERVGDDRDVLDTLAGDRSEAEDVPLWRYLEGLPDGD